MCIYIYTYIYIYIYLYTFVYIYIHLYICMHSPFAQTICVQTILKKQSLVDHRGPDGMTATRSDNKRVSDDT